jgi:hypothetical protein
LKAFYYIKFWFNYLTKSFDNELITSLGEIYGNDIDYYCKINKRFTIKNGIAIGDVNLSKNSGYSYDFYRIIFPFGKDLRFNFEVGDVTHVPLEPTFVKSRPISGENQNSVLLPLDSFRHFKFVHDKTPFESKLDGVVWRGAAHQKHRMEFLRKCSHWDFANIGNTAPGKDRMVEFEKPKLSIREQVKYKFIVSIEGNDVATNLKWIMSSNSVCMMPKPKFETWYKEGALVAGKHYIEIADDYSDLEQKYLKYLKQPCKCKEIILNANAYSSNFKSKTEMLINARKTVLKYMHYSK